jgi:flagellar basal body-associated protein FliL
MVVGVVVVVVLVVKVVGVVIVAVMVVVVVIVFSHHDKRKKNQAIHTVCLNYFAFFSFKMQYTKKIEYRFVTSHFKCTLKTISFTAILKLLNETVSQVVL